LTKLQAWSQVKLLWKIVSVTRVKTWSISGL